VTDSLRQAIAETPFEDHHVHAPTRQPHELDLPAFRRPFTEAAIPEVWAARLGSQLGYRWMLRALARLLDVTPDEQLVVAARNAIEPATYHRLLADDANLGAAYADDLYAAGQCYDVREWSALLGGRPVYRVLRIEAFVEQQLSEAATLSEALDVLGREVDQAAAKGIVALKSIAGYRCGLAFEPPSDRQRSSAEEQYKELRASALGGRPARLAAKELVDTLVWTALERATPQSLPMQFHVAFGDDDIVMTRNDPTLMRALFLHEPFRGVPLVLLHCYPFQRKAGYLASLYPNVYVDLGLTIPNVGVRAEQIIDEALELTPIDQLLASTDGHGTPEFQWHGIWAWRWALDRIFSRYVDLGVLDDEEAAQAARAILRDNARRIYPVSAQGETVSS
jgi:hypothetical protein